MAVNLDKHFEYFSNLLTLIPLPKLQDNSSGSDAEDTTERQPVHNEDKSNGNSVKLSPDKLWEKYQSKLSELRGSRAHEKRKPREKESPKTAPKTKRHKKTPKTAEKLASSADGSGEVQFSQLTFKSNVDISEVIPRKKNYTKLFIQAEKKQQRMKNLQTVDPSKAEEAIETEQWSTAMSKLEGRKQRDDVKKLHKSWKQVQKRKNDSRKRLSDRISSQQKQTKDKQDKRRTHIKERRDLKLENKIKKRRNR